MSTSNVIHLHERILMNACNVTHPMQHNTPKQQVIQSLSLAPSLPLSHTLSRVRARALSLPPSLSLSQVIQNFEGRIHFVPLEVLANKQVITQAGLQVVFYTLHPTPLSQTPNPKPQTLNPKP
jgi:hypothetical protein